MPGLTRVMLDDTRLTTSLEVEPQCGSSNVFQDAGRLRGRPMTVTADTNAFLFYKLLANRCQEAAAQFAVLFSALNTILRKGGIRGMLDTWAKQGGRSTVTPI